MSMRLSSARDDPAIADVAVSCGAKVPFLRPTSLAQDDDSPTVDVILHALEQLPEYSEVVCLVTSPLRAAEDIDGAIEECRALDGSRLPQ